MSAWFNELSSTNLKVLIAGLLSLGTCAAYILLLWHGKTPDELTWGMWLTYMASLWGLQYAGYVTKRKTFQATTVPLTEQRLQAEGEGHDPGA